MNDDELEERAAPARAEWIDERLANLRDVGDSDPEAAHALEDDLWEDVLRAIAAGADEPEKLAREALLTQEVKFPRWYA